MTTARGLLVGTIGLAVSCAPDPRVNRPVERELNYLSHVATDLVGKKFEDDIALFDTLAALAGAESARGARSGFATLVFPDFERRFYLAPSTAQSATGASGSTLALTSTSETRPLAFCADTTPLVCVRRDGFEPHVRAGRCDDPLCDVFARGEQVKKASDVFFGK